MIWPWQRRAAERRRRAIVDALYELRRELPSRRQYIDDMILYAEIGKDRLKLTEDWVAKTRDIDRIALFPESYRAGK